MGGFRKFIIKIAEVVTVLTIVVFTIWGAVWGAGGAALVAGNSSWILGFFLLGAFGGFALASGSAAILFLLIEIAANTRRAS